MLMYRPFDPVVLQIGPVAIHRNGLTAPVALRPVHAAGAERRLRHEPTCRSPGRRLEPARPRRPAVLGRAGRDPGGRLGYSLFLPSRLTTRPTRWRSSGGKGGMSFWRHAGRDRRHGAVGAPRIRLLAAGDRYWRRPARRWAWPRDGGQLHQWRAVGPRGRPAPALGDGLRRCGACCPMAATAAPSLADLPVLLEARCCSCCCGCTRASRARRGRSAAPSAGLWAFRFVAEYFASPMRILPAGAGHEHGQWLCLPMMAVGIALGPGPADVLTPRPARLEVHGFRDVSLAPAHTSRAPAAGVNIEANRGRDEAGGAARHPACVSACAHAGARRRRLWRLDRAPIPARAAAGAGSGGQRDRRRLDHAAAADGQGKLLVSSASRHCN